MRDAEVTTPSGIHIAYNDEKHRYDVDGERYPSVTTLLGVIDKSGPLMAWAVRETKEGRDYRETRDTAATRGTSVHDALEVLATDGTPPSLSDFPEEDRGYVQGLCSWWLEAKPEPLMVEQVVASRLNRFAGRFDLLANIGGESWLVDLKTSGSVYPEMHFQIAAYELALVECGWPRPDHGGILRVDQEGTYEFVVARATEEDFLTVASLYESLKRVRRKPKKLAA